MHSVFSAVPTVPLYQTVGNAWQEQRTKKKKQKENKQQPRGKKVTGDRPTAERPSSRRSALGPGPEGVVPAQSSPVESSPDLLLFPSRNFCLHVGCMQCMKNAPKPPVRKRRVPFLLTGRVGRVLAGRRCPSPRLKRKTSRYLHVPASPAMPCMHRRPGLCGLLPTPHLCIGAHGTQLPFG